MTTAVHDTIESGGFQERGWFAWCTVCNRGGNENTTVDLGFSSKISPWVVEGKPMDQISARGKEKDEEIKNAGEHEIWLCKSFHTATVYRIYSHSIET